MEAKKRNLQTALVFFFLGLMFGYFQGHKTASVPRIDPNNFQIKITTEASQAGTGLLKMGESMTLTPSSQSSDSAEEEVKADE